MAEAWRSLLRAQGRVEFPARISCTDPRSQKRDLGHPSIVSDDVVWGACRKTFPGRGIHTEISPLRYAPVEITNLVVKVELSSRPERSAVERSAVSFFALERSVHDPAAVDVEGLTGHRIA
jgi:hypothetical protein